MAAKYEFLQWGELVLRLQHSWRSYIPVFCAEDCLQLKLYTQPYLGVTYPRTPVGCVCNACFFGFCSQPHATLPMAMCNSQVYYRPEEAGNIKE